MSRSPSQLALFWTLAVFIGVGVFFLTCLVEPANRATLNFGTEYGQMAEHPLQLIGKFPHRLLGPLLANLLGLAGERYWLFAHGCTALMIALLFAAARHYGAGFWQALTLTGVIAFTGTVQIFKGHVGYPDPITFAFLLAALIAIRRPMTFWTLMLLNVMNHEQIFFFWPWLLYWRRVEGGARWWQDVLGVAAIAGIYVSWRYYVGTQATDLTLTMDHYMGLQYFPIGTLGLATLNVASTYMWFGLLPCLIAWHAFADGFRKAGFGILLYVASIFAIFAVAHDVYRFTCFLFVPVFFAGLRLLRERNGGLILAWLGVGSTAAIVMQRQVFVDVAIEVMKHLPTPVPAIVPNVIPAMWGTFVCYGLAVVVTIGIGWWWARAASATVPSDLPDNAEATSESDPSTSATASPSELPDHPSELPSP